VNTAVSQSEQALQAQVDAARQKLDGHTRDLRAIDGELESLAVQRQQHQLVDEVLGSLEKLGELGGAELFWGKGQSASQSAQYIRHVRERGESFRKRLADIDSRRQAVIGQLAHDEEILAYLEDDLYDAQEEEARRKLEWIVEREIGAIAQRAQVMAWTRGGEDDRRFRRSLATSLLVCLLFGLLLPFIDLPLPERADVIEVPERLASLIRERQVKAVLPPPSKPEEIKPELKEPEPVPELKPTDEPPPPADLPSLAEVPSRPPAPATDQPSPEPQKQTKGILAFREKLSNLAEGRPSTRLGSNARISGAGEAAVGRTERSMVTRQGPGSSGGINLAALSRDVGGGGGGGGGQLAGVQVTRASSSIGDITGADRPLSGGPGMSRTDEEIQIVFDRHKAALYRLYNRELRKDPTLRGQIVLRLTIEPDGRVSLCQLQASDMNAPELSAQIVDRVRTFDFGAKDDIPAITILYPIDFLPAA